MRAAPVSSPAWVAAHQRASMAVIGSTIGLLIEGSVPGWGWGVASVLGWWAAPVG